MTREQPIAKTLRSMGLSDAELDDVLWNNCFRFLGIDPPKLSSFNVGTTVSSLSTFLDPLEDDDVPQPWTSPGPVAQRPPRLLLTLLGDYWWQRTEPLPSAAIVALLAEFGVSDSAARAALSRLTRNGLLVTSRSGRRTFVRLSARAPPTCSTTARGASSPSAAAPRRGTGMWSLVAFSIPEEHRAARDELRKALRWLGFAPLYDGLWVSPRDHAERGDGAAEGARHHHRDRVPRHRAAAPRGGERAGLPPTSRPAPGTWPGCASGTRSSPRSPACCATRPRPARSASMDALVARTRVMNEWRAFPAMDPDLPDELLPAGLAARRRP